VLPALAGELDANWRLPLSIGCGGLLVLLDLSLDGDRWVGTVSVALLANVPETAGATVVIATHHDWVRDACDEVVSVGTKVLSMP
jgi:hypothetical protein